MYMYSIWSAELGYKVFVQDGRTLKLGNIC